MKEFYNSWAPGIHMPSHATWVLAQPAEPEHYSFISSMYTCVHTTVLQKVRTVDTISTLTDNSLLTDTVCDICIYQSSRCLISLTHKHSIYFSSFLTRCGFDLKTRNWLSLKPVQRQNLDANVVIEPDSQVTYPGNVYVFVLLHFTRFVLQLILFKAPSTRHVMSNVYNAQELTWCIQT